MQTPCSEQGVAGAPKFVLGSLQITSAKTLCLCRGSGFSANEQGCLRWIEFPTKRITPTTPRYQSNSSCEWWPQTSTLPPRLTPRSPNFCLYQGRLLCEGFWIGGMDAACFIIPWRAVHQTTIVVSASVQWSCILPGLQSSCSLQFLIEKVCLPKVLPPPSALPPTLHPKNRGFLDFSKFLKGFCMF